MRLKRSIPTFVFGVSIGLVIGVAFFVFKLNDLFDRLRSNADQKITVIQQPVKVVTDQKEKTKKDKDRFKINLGKKSKVNYREVDSLISVDDNLKIATDELLTVKNVKVIKIDDKSSASDSLAARLSNVEQNPNTGDLYFIEFWKTPLNTKGYRFSKNKIMLYGVLDYSNVLLYQVENAYYLKCSGQVYRLNAGGEFQKLEKVVDAEMLAKLS